MWKLTVNNNKKGEIEEGDNKKHSYVRDAMWWNGRKIPSVELTCTTECCHKTPFISVDDITAQQIVRQIKEKSKKKITSRATKFNVAVIVRRGQPTYTDAY